MTQSGHWQSVLRTGKRLIGWVVVLLLVVLTVLVVFPGTPFEGFADGIDRIEADNAVTVRETDRDYVLEPIDTDADTGLVFYPGARVGSDAHLESLASVTRGANVKVVVPWLQNRTAAPCPALQAATTCLQVL